MSNATKVETTNVDLHDVTHLQSLTTKSSQIRYLATIYQVDGIVQRGRIAKILDIRYQWVRNVLITPLKK